MKKIFSVIFAAIALSFAAYCQTTPQEYLEKYSRLIQRLGYAGVGIETYLDKWEEAFPQDGRMLEARCNYYLAKSMTTEVVIREGSKFLGNKPVISLPDSSGRKINYFEEHFFDDEVFGTAVKYIDRAIQLYPLDILYRADKVNLLLAYEKESPDLAVAEIENLVEMEQTSHPEWTFDGAPLEEGEFSQLISGYCVSLYNVASPISYDAFYSISRQMCKLEPKEPNWLDNIGSYWLVARGNDRKAMSFYKKALKLNKEDQVAKSNISLIERRRAHAKKSAKGSRP